MFISETIEVEIDKTDRQPIGFVWRGETKNIRQVISEWQDWGFAAGTSRPDWRQRRHRNYYQVECDDGKVYEIYRDRRSIENQTWYLYRIL